MKNKRMMSECMKLYGTLIGLLLCTLSLYAQMNVSGVVYDTFNQPIKDVNVQTANGRNGTTTSFDGSYRMDVSDGSDGLVFSASGYRDAKVNIDGNNAIDVYMEYDAHKQDRMVSLGYFSQPGNAITGAVSIVEGRDLEKTPTSTLSYTFEGRLAGVITKETNAELSMA